MMNDEMREADSRSMSSVVGIEAVLGKATGDVAIGRLRRVRMSRHTSGYFSVMSSRCLSDQLGQ